MKKIIASTVICFLLLVSPARAATIPLVSGAQDVPSLQSYLNNLINQINAGAFNLTANSVWTAISSASGICSAIFSPNGDPCTLFFGFADPRAYGATCNAQAADDTNGLINAAKNAYGSPVKIPTSSCRMEHGFVYDRTGVVYFANPTNPDYNAVSDLTKPYIYLDTNSMGQSIAFDTNHKYGWAFENINLLGVWPAPGTAAIGNHSGAAGSYFGDLINVGISNVSTDIGESTQPYMSGNMCEPNALTSGTGMSFVAHNLRMANSCNGMVQNIFDSFADEVYCTSMMGNCLASTGGNNNFGVNAEISMLRVEYAGAASYDGTYQHNGACIYYNSTGTGYLGLHIGQIEADHCVGPAVEQGPLASGLSIMGGGIQDSNTLHATGVLDTHILMQAGASNFFWYGTFFNTTSGYPTHAFTTNGNVDYVTISNMSSVGASSGTFNNINGTIPHFTEDVQGLYFTQTDKQGIMIGTAAPLSALDVGGGTAIGSSYAGVTAAPTNGLIVQGQVGLGTSVPVGTSAAEVYGNHLVLLDGTSPTVSVGTAAANVTDHYGSVTVSSATSTTLTFAHKWDHTPTCVPVNSTSSGNPYTSAISQTAATFSFPSTTGTIGWICF